jgi:cytoskeleton protein RodZ
MARLVGVDQQSVMDAFDRAIGRDGPLSSSDLAPAEAVAEPTRFAPALIGLMLAAFLGLGWWVYQSGSLQRAESENTASVPSDTSAADDPAAQEPGLQDVPEAVTNPHSAESGVAAVESPQPAVVPPAPDSTVQGSSQSVTLHFNGDSWVSVTDAEGTRLIYEMATKGGSRSVQGKAPFKLVLGRPADIALEYNGRQYDHGFTSNRVPARLTLGP